MENNEKNISQNIYDYETMNLPILPIRSLVALPKMSLHLDVGRKKSISAVNLAMKKDKYIFLVTQKNMTDNEPDFNSLYHVGTIARIKQVLKLPGDEIRTSLEVLCRAVIDSDLYEENNALNANIRIIQEIKIERTENNEVEALMRETLTCFDTFISLIDKVAPELIPNVLSINEAGALADYITQNLYLRYEDKQLILEAIDPIHRLETLIEIIIDETDILRIEKEIGAKVRDKLARNQREYYVREQIKILQEEIGDGDNPASEADEYRYSIDKMKAPNEIKEKLYKEVNRLYKMPQGSHEGSVIRTYLETCIELPWTKQSKDNINIAKSQKILDNDHYGLEKIKERILEWLSVKVLMPESKGQIICLVGPPGTGKTSIAHSIARCMGRKFARISLGGVHDESEIRGHRRTYIGAMPGKIINAIKDCGTSNPVILLDEIDKLGSDYKGDPSSALLEVLDPEQNKSFKDHFIDMDFDLSKVFFITTANISDTIPAPLLDRMEVIELSSYTQEEKFWIAKKHLFPKQLKKHGITAKQLKIADNGMNEIIAGYTREAGVRKLERTLQKICRKTAKILISDDSVKNVTVTLKNLEEFLGPVKYKNEFLPKTDLIGVVTGLAYTSVGGEIMPIEINVMEGNGKIELTGSLGDVMKESARAAISYIRSKAKILGVDPDFYKTKDIHLHVPEGAVPKDGPSAGITITTALISELSQRPVRRDLAMTGEVTLRGRVLPIGGLKEKTMAAYKAGVKTIIIPKDNMSDLADVDKTVKENVEFIPAEIMDDVLKVALLYKNDENIVINDDEIIPMMITNKPTIGIKQ